MVSINDVLKASKGLPVDDIFAELWGRKLSSDYTIATYTGTLPATLTGTKAGYLHRYKIFGNLTQNGTPTPENPIVPSECGERTENLFDYIYYFNHTGAGVNVYFNLKGVIALEANTTYTFSTNFMSKTSGVRETPFIACKHGGTPTTANGGFGNDISVTITTDATGMIDLYTRTSKGGAQSDVDIPTLSDFQNGKWVMLNEGSTAFQYEPYGYKLPLLSGSTPVDIYLGNEPIATYDYVDYLTQTTHRKWGKKVCDGTENWSLYTASRGRGASFSPPGMRGGYYQTGYCTHAVIATNTTVAVGRMALGVSTAILYWFGILDVLDLSTIEEFKSWLADQYNAGTPVTIYYPLNRPTTTPIEVPAISTTANSTTISWAGNGLAPSEVEFEYERK